MMTRLRRIFSTLFVLAAVALTVALLPFAQSRQASAASYDPDKNYSFRSIDVNIEVRRDKTFRITEQLEVYFGLGGVNTGIIRDIQRVSSTTRLIDGQQKKGAKYLAELSDVEVTIDGEPAKVTRSLYENGEFHSVKMQRADESYFGSSEKEGTHLFALSYTYDMSDDKISGCDDFTFDVLGYAMAECRSFTATVVFPVGAPLNDVTVRSDRETLWQPEEGEEFSVSDGTIRIRTNARKKGNGLTLQVILPEGYFSEAGSRTFFPAYIVAIVLLIVGVGGACALIAVFRPRKGIAPVAFYPPENMSLARFSAMWHGRARRKDLASYLLKWAADGYLTLEQDGKRHFLAHWTGKTPADAPKEEQNLFDAFYLACGGKTFSTRQLERRTSSRVTLSKAADKLEKAANKPSPYVKGQQTYSVLIALFSLLPMFGVLIYNAILFHSAIIILFAVFMAAGTAVGTLQVRASLFPTVAWIFPVAFMGMPVVAMCLSFYIPLYDYAGLLWISLAWWAASFFFHKLYGKRPEESQREFGEMRGFKNFLLTAEIERIEYLLKEDPDYLCEVLPYCLVMGIGKKVQKRFAALKYALPEWGNYNMQTFSRSISHVSGGGGGGSGSHGGGGGGGSHGGGGGGGGSRGC